MIATKTTFKSTVLGDFGLLALKEKVTDLNKRAEKHGLEPITVEVRTVQFVKVQGYERQENGIFLPQFAPSSPLHFVDITGVEPCIEGWRLIAKVEFDADLGNIVKTVPGYEADLDPKYRTIAPICEHCNTTRRRHDVFVLTNDGQEKVVGRNCLADFVRSGDAEKLAAFAEFAELIKDVDRFDECSDDYFGGMGGVRQPIVTTLNYLTMVSCCIRKWGWTSRTAAKEFDKLATTDDVAKAYWGRKCEKYIAEHKLYPSEFDYKTAEEALTWARMKRNDSSEYLHTIAKLAEAEYVNWKYDGYIASIIASYLREQDALEKRKAKPPRVFLGEVGKRIKGLPVKVVRLRFTEGMYGTKTIVTFEHAIEPNRAVLTWFASGDQSDLYNEGEDVTIDCTVKEHESNERYGDSTIVTRVAISKLSKRKCA